MKKLFLIFFVLFFTNAFSQNWTLKLDGRSVWSLAQDRFGNLYAGGLTSSNSRIWKSSNQGNTWDTIFIGTGQTMWGFGFDTLGTPGNMYVANFSNGLLKSTNGGLNFTVMPTSLFMGKNPQGVTCSKAGNIYVTTATGFFRSTNGGVSFDTALTGYNCLPVLVDRSNQNIVYVGVTSAGGQGIGFYRSTDAGATFGPNLNPGKNGYNFVQKSDGTIYQVTTTSPYNVDKSTNQGLNWTTQGNATGAMRSVAIGILPGWIFVGGNGGVFSSTNDGATFTNYNLTGSVTPILSTGSRLFAGVSGTGAGLYYHDYPTSVSNNSLSVTDDYHLYQNYPNPFNPTTKIVYELKRANFISLKIYDALGNELKEIDNGFKNAGKYGINFIGENLSSGLYFARLNVDGNTLTSRLVLVK
ncbi:MAG: T9SS type A sorting domain-containing protein [Bacteroidetes bacterium]|nr:T9SS type A sorting domain-containing protein [Bacteroidota bacterium]